MNTYRTAEIAGKIGIHPNTVRLYEELKLIPKPKRMSNGYRIFTNLHLEQMILVKMALKAEILHSGLRKQAIEILKEAALLQYDTAIGMTRIYGKNITKEQIKSEEAIEIAKKLLSGRRTEMETSLFTRKQAADYLDITIDSLRNWEMNGLLTVKRKQNGYRVYTGEDIRRLKIIRALRSANYSLSAILRMLNAISHSPDADIRLAINTPTGDEDIISVCDKLLTSLQEAKDLAKSMEIQLKKMKQLFYKNPTL